MTDANQYGGNIQPMPSPYRAPSLAEWLTARLDEDERTARAAFDPEYPKEATWFSNWDPTIGHQMVTNGYGNGVGDVFGNGGPARHVAAWNPARVLTEIAAKRAILALHDRQQHCCPASFNPAGAVHGTVWGIPDGDDCRPECATLLTLARPYAGQPGWREEWGTEE